MARTDNRFITPTKPRGTESPWVAKWVTMLEPDGNLRAAATIIEAHGEHITKATVFTTGDDVDYDGTVCGATSRKGPRRSNAPRSDSSTLLQVTL